MVEDLDMLTREMLERMLPDGSELRRAVRRIAGADWVEDEDDFVERALTWLVEQSEAEWSYPYSDRHARPEWYTNPEHPEYQRDYLWSVQAWGLRYKQSTDYLTAEGWPMGTTCWYVRVECGSYYYAAAAEGPRLALARAIVVVAALRARREVPPKRRSHLESYLEGALRDA